jgi:hypothetical protein
VLVVEWEQRWLMPPTDHAPTGLQGVPLPTWRERESGAGGLIALAQFSQLSGAAGVGMAGGACSAS